MIVDMLPVRAGAYYMRGRVFTEGRATRACYDIDEGNVREDAERRGLERWAVSVVKRRVRANYEAIVARLWHPQGRLMLARYASSCRRDRSSESLGT